MPVRLPLLPLSESGEGGGGLYLGFRPFRALSGEWRSR